MFEKRGAGVEVDASSRTVVIEPLFYHCCWYVICPITNSKEYQDGLPKTMCCCRWAGPLLEDLKRISGIDFIKAEGTRITLTAIANIDFEQFVQQASDVRARNRAAVA